MHHLLTTRSVADQYSPFPTHCTGRPASLQPDLIPVIDDQPGTVSSNLDDVMISHSANRVLRSPLTMMAVLVLIETSRPICSLFLKPQLPFFILYKGSLSHPRPFLQRTIRDLPTLAVHSGRSSFTLFAASTEQDRQ